MKRILAAAVCLGLAVPLFAQNKQDEILTASYQVLKEILATPDKGIPRDLLDKSECVIVYPSVKKAAFIVGDKLRPGSPYLPFGRKPERPLERTSHFRSRRRQLRTPGWRTGDRFCASDHERPGGTVRLEEQG